MYTPVAKTLCCQSPAPFWASVHCAKVFCRVQRQSNVEGFAEELCNFVFMRNHIIARQDLRWRPYRVERTGSLPTSEVKRRRARLVLGWGGAAREDLRVLPAFWANRCEE